MPDLVTILAVLYVSLKGRVIIPELKMIKRGTSKSDHQHDTDDDEDFVTHNINTSFGSIANFMDSNIKDKVSVGWYIRALRRVRAIGQRGRDEQTAGAALFHARNTL